MCLPQVFLGIDASRSAFICCRVMRGFSRRMISNRCLMLSSILLFVAPSLANLVVSSFSQTGTFRDGTDLVKTWDECQYLMQEQSSERPMTSLMRYRIREKYPPPKSICPLGGRPKKTLTTETRAILAKFFEEDTKYPSTDQKIELAEQTRLTRIQVHNWFANRRRKRVADSKRKQETARSTNSLPVRAGNVHSSHNANAQVGRDLYSQFQVRVGHLPPKTVSRARHTNGAEQSVTSNMSAAGSTQTGFQNSDSYMYCRYQAGVMEAVRPHRLQTNHSETPSLAYLEQKMSSRALYATPQIMANQPHYPSTSGDHGGGHGGHPKPVAEKYSGRAYQEQHGYYNPLTMLHTAAEIVSSLDVDRQQFLQDENSDRSSGNMNVVPWAHSAPYQRAMPVHTYTFEHNYNSHPYGIPQV